MARMGCDGGFRVVDAKEVRESFLWEYHNIMSQLSDSPVVDLKPRSEMSWIIIGRRAQSRWRGDGTNGGRARFGRF